MYLAETIRYIDGSMEMRYEIYKAYENKIEYEKKPKHGKKKFPYKKIKETDNPIKKIIVKYQNDKNQTPEGYTLVKGTSVRYIFKKNRHGRLNAIGKPREAIIKRFLPYTGGISDMKGDTYLGAIIEFADEKKGTKKVMVQQIEPI